MDTLEGLVIRTQSGFLIVKTESGEFTCRLRGRLKQDEIEGDIAAIGDRVRITNQTDGTGMIEKILERTSVISRIRSGIKREFRQILLANPDQIVTVFACAEPEPHLRMLDRFLVIAEKENVNAVIIANKVDLVKKDAVEALFDVYARLGYPVIYTSAKSGQGIDLLKTRLKDKISALVGPSGTGKSSLLNLIQPDLGLRVRAVSEATSKGRHTTQVRELFALDMGGYVADTPGIRSLALFDTEPEELDGYFVEMRDLVSECKFNDCSHTHEPGCAVREAVSAGEIASERYASYLRLRYEDDAPIEADDLSED